MQRQSSSPAKRRIAMLGRRCVLVVVLGFSSATSTRTSIDFPFVERNIAESQRYVR